MDQELMDGPKFGEKAICKMCGKHIIYVGPYWKHIGKLQPRHPAQPEDEIEPLAA